MPSTWSNWPHSDAAWSPYYEAPAGVDGEPCQHVAMRCRIGPTSRKRDWSIIVDECSRCGRVLRTIQDLAWRQYDWLRRLNRKK